MRSATVTVWRLELADGSTASVRSDALVPLDDDGPQDTVPAPVGDAPGPAEQDAAAAQSALFDLLNAATDPAVRDALTTGFFLGMRCEVARGLGAAMGRELVAAAAEDGMFTRPPGGVA
jgi:hypothetical protein